MGYKVGAQWAGNDRWECEDCPYDSLSEQDMIEHVAVVHAPPPPPKAVGEEEEPEEEEEEEGE